MTSFAPVVDVVRNGYSILPLALCENQNIRLKRIVKKISYNKTGVEVSVENGEDAKHEMIETYRAEAVLVTVPLGVLKEKVIVFDPPLPEEKQSAIDRLGFGNLNKVRRSNARFSEHRPSGCSVLRQSLLGRESHSLRSRERIDVVTRRTVSLLVFHQAACAHRSGRWRCCQRGRMRHGRRDHWPYTRRPTKHLRFSHRSLGTFVELISHQSSSSASSSFLAQRISRHPLEIRPIRAWLVFVRRCGRVG